MWNNEIEKENNWKLEPNFCYESGVIEAAEILQKKGEEEGEFANVAVIRVTHHTMILHGSREEVMKAVKFVISQNWPVKSLSMVWPIIGKKIRPAFWKLDFHDPYA